VRPMCSWELPPRLAVMALKLWIVAIALFLLVLAIGGWAVDGLRWLWRGGPVRRPATT
jgi:hypothetical protein